MGKIMPAAEAKTHFGALLDTVQREPVTISRNGRPVAVVLSAEDYQTHEALKLESLRRDVQAGIDELDRGNSTDGVTFMKRLIDETG